MGPAGRRARRRTVHVYRLPTRGIIEGHRQSSRILYPLQRSITGLIRRTEALTQPLGAARLLRESRPDVARNQRDRRTRGDLTDIPKDGP